MVRDKFSERVGTIGVNIYGSKMVVDEYNSSRDIWVKFIDNGNRVHTQWEPFTTGNIRNVYDRTVYGVGYIGEGEYKVSVGKIYTPQYISWSNMMQRGYDTNLKTKYPTYKECSVSEEWHNFQNFAEWYDENYYEIKGKTMCLDKDILIKDNKLYSPETCVFVPKNINSLFVKNNSKRGNMPIGVNTQKGKIKNPYRASCSNGKKYAIGWYNTIEEAFQAYKEHKENQIKKVANEYKSVIPSKLFNALIKYEVEIND